MKIVSSIQDDCPTLINQNPPRLPEKPDDTSDYSYLCNNSTLYDYNFGWDTRHANWTDPTQATEYLRRLGNCMDDCRTVGTRWSTIYILCTTLMMTIAVQGLLLTTGVWFFPTRFAAMMTQAFCNCFLFAGTVTVAVYRFNTMGKLASLSLAPVNLSTNSDGDPTLTDERTYVDDGQLILRLWSISLVFVVA